MRQAIRERNPHRFVRKTWAWIAVITVAFWLTLGNRQTSDQARDAAGEAHAVAVRVHALVGELRSAIVLSCERNGNARAKVQREVLNEEIEETKHPDPEALQALVEAGVSEKVIYESERKARAKLEDRLARVKLVDCANEYQIGVSE